MPRCTLACAALASVAIISFRAHAADANGIWMRDDGNAKVKIAQCGTKICATNLWIRDTSKGEEVGDKLVLSLQRASDTELYGSAYDAKRDRTYSIIIIVEPRSLITRGCLLGRVLCRDVSWTRAPQ